MLARLKTNIREKPGMSEREKREEVKSCISRQTEMKRRCLWTKDKPSLTAARGSDLCQCVDDRLQRHNMLETNLQFRGGKKYDFFKKRVLFHVQAGTQQWP